MAIIKYVNVTKTKNHGKYVKYEGHIMFNKKMYAKRFDTPEEAAKFVDRICIKLGIPQKNNTFKPLK